MYKSVWVAVGVILVGLALPACESSSPPTTRVMTTALATGGATTSGMSRAGGKATPTRETGAEYPPEISKAFAKTRAVTNVRYDISSEVTLTRNGAPVQQPGLSVKGEENGANHHLAISGIMDPNGTVSTYESVTLDGVTYTRGLRGLPGVDSTQWYRFGKELGNVTSAAPSVKTLLAQLEAQDLASGDLEADGSEQVDGLTCAIWVTRNPKLAQGFIGIANSREVSTELGAMDSAEFKLWTCADGYIHRITAGVEGHDPQNAADKASVHMTFHIFDQDVPVVLTAPADAKDFELPVDGSNAEATP